jgi:uncharacterized protein
LLSRVCKQTIVKEKTLIVFDEIQLCERALTALKYFQEQANEYHIVACGSLLGVAVNRKQYSFPVGKVDMKTMYSLNMEEFLMALGEEELVHTIRQCFSVDQPMPTVLHKQLLQYYRLYLLVGGMPECVKQYIDTKDFILIRNTQDMILQGYLDDMSKYNVENEIKKTRQTYSSVTVQLSKKNTRFQYKLVKKGGRASEFENAIEWLTLSGIVTQIFKVEQARLPLENYKDIDAFKIYISDVGLLCAKKDIVPESILYETNELDDFKGGMTENYVLSQLKSNGYTCYYWTSCNRAEIDFVLQKEGNVVPIEVKSTDNSQAKSLKVYMSSYEPKYAIKLSTRNFGFENNIKTIPLYAAFCI